MTIYADTSFLVSLLYSKEKHHAAARGFFLNQPGAEWLTSQWSRHETVNSLRQLCRDSAGPTPPQIEAVRRMFKHLHKRGPFLKIDADMESAVTESERISTMFGTQLKMRSADVLHIGILDELQAELFVTRDKDQFALAQAMNFKSVLI